MEGRIEFLLNGTIPKSEKIIERVDDDKSEWDTTALAIFTNQDLPIPQNAGQIILNH